MFETLEKRLAGGKESMSAAEEGRYMACFKQFQPITYMACFKLPVWVIKIIDQIRRTFIWMNSEGNKPGVSLLNFQAVCLPKSTGGLGMKNIRLQNMAMLMKWI
jgi:hypothetical protein